MMEIVLQYYYTYMKGDLEGLVAVMTSNSWLSGNYGATVRHPGFESCSCRSFLFFLPKQVEFQ